MRQIAFIEIYQGIYQCCVSGFGWTWIPLGQWIRIVFMKRSAKWQKIGVKMSKKILDL
jgi:hypothetical protein